jgi:hypothetical protein
LLPAEVLAHEPFQPRFQPFAHAVPPTPLPKRPPQLLKRLAEAACVMRGLKPKPPEPHWFHGRKPRLAKRLPEKLPKKKPGHPERQKRLDDRLPPQAKLGRQHQPELFQRDRVKWTGAYRHPRFDKG